jgi:hypothetical protein
VKIHHILKVHWDRRTPEVTSEWIADRCRFFNAWTMKSLEKQTFQGFRTWMSCGVNMTEDDVLTVKRYTDADDVTRNNQHEPDDILRRSISPDVSYVYVTRLDSDDLLAPDALQIAHDTPPQEVGRTEASMFRRGYLHDVRTGETGVYHGSSTPFHTMMIPREVFCDTKRYAVLDYGDHSLVNSRYPTKVLPDWRFTVLVHGGNFISDMSYGRERIFNVESSWSVERFLRQPVTFDVDDFCDRWNCLPALDRLKEQYPNFRCTLFTIPSKTSADLELEARSRSWIEIAIHGVTHEPNEELKAVTPQIMYRRLEMMFDSKAKHYYIKGFRPPGWYITAGHISALNSLGMWVALHKRDERKLGPLCKHGFYCCGDRPYWHGHTSGEGNKAHSVCGNGIDECLPELLKRWPRDQSFSFVSESVGKIQ